MSIPKRWFGSSEVNVMETEAYLRQATRDIYDTDTRNEVRNEIRSHIKDLIEEYKVCGIPIEEAEHLAVEQMGDPNQVSREFHKIYRPKVEWKEIVYLVAWVIGLYVFKLLWSISGINPTMQFILLYLGIVFLLFGIVWSAVEKYMDLPFLYAWGKNWGAGGLGGAANSCVFVAMALVMITSSRNVLCILTIATAVLLQVERLMIAGKRQKKEQKYLWEMCTAQEDFEFRGKVKLGEKIKKVQIKKGEKVQKGDILLIVGIDGFTLTTEIMISSLAV